jgi:hypothetical protein
MNVIDYPEQGVRYLRIPAHITNQMLSEILADFYFLRHSAAINQEAFIWPMQSLSRVKKK